MHNSKSILKYARALDCTREVQVQQCDAEPLPGSCSMRLMCHGRQNKTGELDSMEGSVLIWAWKGPQRTLRGQGGGFAAYKAVLAISFHDGFQSCVCGVQITRCYVAVFEIQSKECFF